MRQNITGTKQLKSTLTMRKYKKIDISIISSTKQTSNNKQKYNKEIQERKKSWKKMRKGECRELAKNRTILVYKMDMVYRVNEKMKNNFDMKIKIRVFLKKYKIIRKKVDIGFWYFT